MTVKKAIEMLQNLRNAELETLQIFDGNLTLEGTIRRITKRKADYLELILHELEPQTYPCTHPSKWHDNSGGQLYCMGCNQNL